MGVDSLASRQEKSVVVSTRTPTFSFSGGRFITNGRLFRPFRNNGREVVSMRPVQPQAYLLSTRVGCGDDYRGGAVTVLPTFSTRKRPPSTASFSFNTRLGQSGQLGQAEACAGLCWHAKFGVKAVWIWQLTEVATSPGVVLSSRTRVLRATDLSLLRGGYAEPSRACGWLLGSTKCPPAGTWGFSCSLPRSRLVSGRVRSLLDDAGRFGWRCSVVARRRRAASDFNCW